MRENDDTPADTLMRADAALHMAKNAGQDHIVTQYELSEDIDTLVFKYTQEAVQDKGKPSEIAA
ncbi:hypothetical protein OAD19_03145 [Octadecabacter sp.]|nr:hypothetical protein [Octadecabacter sp.]MDB9943996.1 hypothetical protein [Octadecabacter sp.]